MIANCQLPIADLTETAWVRCPPIRNRQSAIGNGSALIVVLWVLLILSMLISSFAFDMHVESGITSYYRRRVQTQYLARAGTEYAKLLLTKSFKAKESDIVEAVDADLHDKALTLSKGMGLSGVSQELGGGKFSLDILPEQGRRNVNMLSDEDWEEILDQSGVPQDQWPELIDCLGDWVDNDPLEAHKLNGAESDDPYYEERGYLCKNGPLDTVDELLLVKGFTPSIVYGGPSEDGKETYTGIASWLTTWGNGQVNVNTATREVLLTIPGVDDLMVDEIMEARKGTDMVEGTEDDGIEDLNKISGMTPEIAKALTTSERKYVRIISKGEVGDLRSGIWAVLEVSEASIVPVFWREEDMP